MAKAPRDPQDVFPGVVADYRQLFGQDLVAMIVYGSAAGGAYVPGRSDINLMIVLSEKGIDALTKTFDVVQKWKKQGVATPLFVTEEYVAASLDVFPIEYLNIKDNYRVISGKDILKDLAFDPRNVRLQCEREIKGKLLLLREAFLETRGKGRDLRQLAGQSIEALVAIFKALLFLKGRPLPRDKAQVVKEVCGLFDLTDRPFERILEIKATREKTPAAELTALFEDYLREVKRLSQHVDELTQP